jgi:hypothetical protein
MSVHGPESQPRGAEIRLAGQATTLRKPLAESGRAMPLSETINLPTKYGPLRVSFFESLTGQCLIIRGLESPEVPFVRVQ